MSLTSIQWRQLDMNCLKFILSTSRLFLLPPSILFSFPLALENSLRSSPVLNQCSAWTLDALLCFLQNLAVPHLLFLLVFSLFFYWLLPLGLWTSWKNKTNQIVKTTFLWPYVSLSPTPLQFTVFILSSGICKAVPLCFLLSPLPSVLSCHFLSPLPSRLPQTLHALGNTTSGL